MPVNLIQNVINIFPGRLLRQIKEMALVKLERSLSKPVWGGNHGKSNTRELINCKKKI